jgi:hypothetical protein
LQMLKSSLFSEGYSVTYSYAKNGKVVLSGYTPNGKIYYQSNVICKLYSPEYGYVDVLACANVIYPQSDKSRGEAIVSYFSNFPYE